jgi:gas vesicle protein
MKRFVMGVLIVGSVIAAIALVVRKRSRSGADQWDTFAEDTFARASTSVSKVSDAARDATADVSDTVKDATADVSDTAKDTASKVSKTAKDAASKASDAAKDV